MEIQAMSGIRFFHPKNSPCSSLGPRTPALIYGERIALYLVPLARSRYCASPEASIMRLKAAAKLGATAGAPTQHSYKLQHYSTASVSELSAVGTTVQIAA